MKSIISLLFLLVLSTTMAQSNGFYDLTFTSIDGEEITMSQFKGKKVMLVNVASKCGLTPQYEDLQKLHSEHKDKLVLIGFPCNQFLKQEPGTEEEIKAFCQKNYGVDFLMASKIDVKGENQHNVYKWLTTKEQNGVEDTKVSWNFQKYLIDENGNYMKMFDPRTPPLSLEIITEINK